MDNNIQSPLPNYKVEFKGLTGAPKKIPGILRLSFWEILTSQPQGTSGGIYLTGFWIIEPRLLDSSRDLYIQSQKASPSLTPYIGITILLTEHLHFISFPRFMFKYWAIRYIQIKLLLSLILIKYLLHYNNRDTFFNRFKSQIHNVHFFTIW